MRARKRAGRRYLCQRARNIRGIRHANGHVEGKSFHTECKPKYLPDLEFDQRGFLYCLGRRSGRWLERNACDVGHDDRNRDNAWHGDFFCYVRRRPACGRCKRFGLHRERDATTDYALVIRWRWVHRSCDADIPRIGHGVSGDQANAQATVAGIGLAHLPAMGPGFKS